MNNDVTGLLLLFIKCRLKMRGAEKETVEGYRRAVT